MEIKFFNSQKDFITSATEFILESCMSERTARARSKTKNLALPVLSRSEPIFKATKIALSGGSTPIPIYKALSQSKFLLENTTFYQVDERYVPSSHKNSNQRMILKTLKPQKFHFFDTSLSIKDSLNQYQKLLPKKFDLIILGIGPDGHTASLFPNQKPSTSPVAHTTTTKFPVKDRLTLTFSTILQSKKILVLLQGPQKENLILKLLNPKTNTSNLPAKILLKHKALTFLLQK